MPPFTSLPQVPRRWVLGLATTAGTLALLGGVAAACVVAQGEFRAQSQTTGDQLTVTGDPGNGSLFMQWCNGPYDALQANNSANGDSVNIQVPDADSNTGCAGGINGPNELPDGEYAVTLTDNAFVNGDGSTNSAGNATYSAGELQSGKDCMAMPPTGATPGNGFTILQRAGPTQKDTFRVDGGSAEAGTVTYQIPQSVADNDGNTAIAAGLCITKLDQEDPGSVTDSNDQGDGSPVGYAYAPFVGGIVNTPDSGPPIGNFMPVEIDSTNGE